MVEEYEELEQPITSYEDLVSEDAERDLSLDDVGTPLTLSEAEEETVHKTDMQAAMSYMMPVFRNKRINELMKTAMVSRIPPDHFLDKHFLITASLIEEHEPEDDVDVVGIISQVEDGLLIGFEGRCRIEIGEMVGVAREEEMDKLSKELGL